MEEQTWDNWNSYEGWGITLEDCSREIAERKHIITERSTQNDLRNHGESQTYQKQGWDDF